jgi:signal transduction histidine kinase
MLIMSPSQQHAALLPNPAATVDRHLYLAAFAHDLLNMASGIDAYATMLAQPDDGGDDQLWPLLRSAIAHLISDLRLLQDLARTGTEVAPVCLLPVPLAASWDPALAVCRGLAAAAGCRLVVAALPSGVIRTDLGLLTRVLVNLLKNAIEATPAGACVEVAVVVGVAEVRWRIGNPGAFTAAGCSTKGGGRGLGLLGVRLLLGGCLDGRLELADLPGGGVRAEVVLPRQPPHLGWQGDREGALDG